MYDSMISYISNQFIKVEVHLEPGQSELMVSYGSRLLEYSKTYTHRLAGLQSRHFQKKISNVVKLNLEYCCNVNGREAGKLLTDKLT